MKHLLKFDEINENQQNKALKENHPLAHILDDDGSSEDLTKTSNKRGINRANLLTLDELKQKYPEMIFTFEERKGGIWGNGGRYFARVDIKTQGGEKEYLGALKGPVSEKDALIFFNRIAINNYDKYY